jgi:xanthine dehydrogenase accessory factor
MTCHSGGALDVYIEPVFPKPHLVVCGHSVVAQTLCRLARAIHYRVTIAAPEAPEDLEFEADEIVSTWDLSGIKRTPATFVVVATQGEGDEAAIQEVLTYDWSYAAFVASRKKSRAVFEELAARGIERSALERLRTPAGLDIKARLPEEIAVSILGEMIQHLRSNTPAVESTVPSAGSTAYAHETLTIGGMSCAHCVATVEKVLAKFESIKVEQVSIGSATIGFLPGGMDLQSIRLALEKRGYQLALDTGTVVQVS